MMPSLKNTLAAAALAATITAPAGAATETAEPPRLVDILRGCVLGALDQGVFAAADTSKDSKGRPVTHDTFTFAADEDQSGAVVELVHYTRPEPGISYGYVRIRSGAGEGDANITRDHKQGYRIYGREIVFPEPGPRDKAVAMGTRTIEEDYNKVTETVYGATDRVASCFATNVSSLTFTP